jgi:hypothetical protein
MPPAGDDEALAFGYLSLLQAMLEQLRYRIDRGYSDAADLIEKFQAEVAARAEAGQLDGVMLAYVGAALHQSKIPALPALAAASAKRDSRDEGELDLSDIDAVVAGLLDACAGDPFGFVGALEEVAHAMPEEARVALASSLVLGARSGPRAAAVLFLLDASSAVRRAAAGSLVQVASSLSPVDLRRLIAMRNWRPEEERAELDAIIRKMRSAGIECAPSGAGRIEALFATAIDGASSQAFLLVSPAGRKKCVSSILTKNGLSDAWVGEPESSRGVAAQMGAAGLGALPILDVSRGYFDRVISHHLALTVDRGEAAPLGLLQVAETIGGADWQPERLDFHETLAGLLPQIPTQMQTDEAVAAVLRRSDGFAHLAAITESWFEDDAQIAELVARTSGRGRPKLVEYVLQSAIAKRRDKWAELFLHVVLWMREAPAEANLSWRELTVVAKALADGRDVAEIAMMRDIAKRTVVVLASA